MPGKDGAANKLIVESFANLTDSSPISLVSRTSSKQKNPPVLQVRRDYAQDISQKMSECLTLSGGTPRLTALTPKLTARCGLDVLKLFPILLYSQKSIFTRQKFC